MFHRDLLRRDSMHRPERYLPTLLYTALIYATLPVAPNLWRALKPFLRPSVTFWFVAVGGLVGAALLIKAWRLGGSRRGRRAALLLAVAMGYLLLLFTVFDHPTNAERLHLLLYGGLAWLVSSAAASSAGRWRWWLAALYLVAAGALDEGIQYLLPQRFFDWNDIVGNWLGGLLGWGAWLAASRQSPWADGARRAADQG